MDDPEPGVDRMAHSEWADATLWQFLAEQPELAEDERVLGWLQHIHSVQRGFLSLWRGEEIDFAGVGDFAGPAAIARWGRDGHAGVREFVGTADPATRARTLPIPWAAHFEKKFGRPMGPVTVGESIQQVAMHSSHHRGQIAARMRELGVEPPLVDYIAWIWFERPDPEWPRFDQA